MENTSRANSFRTVANFLIADRQNVEGLEEADRRLAVLGCLLAAAPSSEDVRMFFREAIRSGVSPKKLETALVHGIGYLGVIAARAAHRQLVAALAEAGRADAVTDGAPVTEKRQKRIETGARLYDRFDPGRQARQAQLFATLSSAYYPRAMEMAGLVLGSPLLSLHERQIMTVAMLACMGGQPEQLRFHMGVALRNGVSQEALSGILILVQAYAGMPRANSAAKIALAVVNHDRD